MCKQRSSLILLLLIISLSTLLAACDSETTGEVPEPTSTHIPGETPDPEDEAPQGEGGEAEATAVDDDAETVTRPGSGLTAVIVSGDYAGAGKPFTFDGTQSQAGEAPIVNNEWDMGDGTTLFGLAVEHAYSEPGLYTVSLTIRAEDGQTASTSKEVEILPLEELATPTAVVEFTLVDTGWVLTNAMRGTTVTMIFGEDSLSGSSGCNSYSSRYSIESWEENTTDISVTLVSSTRQVCTQEIMAQERGYLESLASANRVTLDDTTLILETGSGTLTFRAFEITE